VSSGLYLHPRSPLRALQCSTAPRRAGLGCTPLGSTAHRCELCLAVLHPTASSAELYCTPLRAPLGWLYCTPLRATGLYCTPPKALLSTGLYFTSLRALVGSSAHRCLGSTAPRCALYCTPLRALLLGSTAPPCDSTGHYAPRCELYLALRRSAASSYWALLHPAALYCTPLPTLLGSTAPRCELYLALLHPAAWALLHLAASSTELYCNDITTCWVHYNAHVVRPTTKQGEWAESGAPAPNMFEEELMSPR
jgi:hypothetical protein